VFEISLWVLGVLALLIAALKLLVWNRKSPLHKYELVRLNVQLGNVGSVELRPNNEDVQIAHRIWTELMTRKAAQPIDIEHDVIVEIYDSWYALFGRIRQLISDIPGHMLRKEKSTWSRSSYEPVIVSGGKVWPSESGAKVPVTVFFNGLLRIR
jgi:hypothetical protein